ncbi:MAG: ethylbenzene dehydrogenase-related protein [Cyclobacteriaceae bacterium]
MKVKIYSSVILLSFFGLLLSQCTHDDQEIPDPDGNSSTSELLVTSFSQAPVFDGDIDEMWGDAQKLVSTATVPSSLGDRMTYYNEDGIGEDLLDIFEGYEGEAYDFTMRSGTIGSDIYFLIEWDDAEDSKDRQSWYFDPTDKLWKGEHKYANGVLDKYYEDKFSFLFPIGTVNDFNSSTCFASCHSTGGIITNPKDKHTRHYLKTAGQKIDMWHWKRVRGTHNDRVDDQRIVSRDQPWNSSSNGRGGDPGVDGDGTQSGYSDNKQTLTITGTTTDVSVPKYVIPDGTDYYWISEAQQGAEARLVIAVDANGVLTYNGGTIDPTGDAGYNQGTGEKRFPSILTRDFLGARGDIEVKAVHTGTGWICEVKRKLDTGDPDDVVFAPGTELPFGFAIFNNAAIAHAIKPGLTLRFEE